MSWRDNLIQGSFRGVNFYVSSSDYAIGRRNIIHQYPMKDVPYAEDLGLDVDEFSIECYVVANSKNDRDYFTERNALIEAIKKQGKGKLVHPYLGSFDVVVNGKARIRESFTEGGIARFSITFTLAGENKYPKSKVDKIGAVDKVANKVTNVSLDSFWDQYSILNLPSFCARIMSNDFKSFINMSKSAINSVKGAVEGTIETAKKTFDDAMMLVDAVLDYPCQIGALVNQCGEAFLEIMNILGEGYSGLITGVCSGEVYISRLDSLGDVVEQELGISMVENILTVVGTALDDGFGAALDLTTNSKGGALSPIAVSTWATAKQASNRIAFVNNVKTQYLANAAKTAIRINYKSSNKANLVRQKVVNSIEYLMGKLGDESASDPYADYGIYTDNRSVYSGLENLRSVFVSAMSEQFSGLANEVVYQPPPDGITSLQLAYDKYMDLSRENEIFENNQPDLRHPGFINEEINILSE